jgi:hypothetical protein
MKSRGVQFLIVLFVLAFCRIVRDSEPISAPAAETPAPEQHDQKAPTVAFAAPLDHIEDLEWFAPEPVKSDPTPATQPAAQQDDSSSAADAPAVVWTGTRLILPVTIPGDLSPAETYVASNRTFPAIVDDPPGSKLLQQMDVVSLASSGGQASDNGSTRVLSPIPQAPTPAMMVDAPVSSDTPVSTEPPDVGSTSGSLPPLATQPPAGGSGSPPAPEPSAAFCLLIVMLTLRASKRRRMALS